MLSGGSEWSGKHSHHVVEGDLIAFQRLLRL